MSRIVRGSDWMTDGLWRGQVEGRTLGTGVTILFYGTDVVGHGPTLHVHPYDEVFIVREGRGRFTVGEEVLDAGAGDVVFGPAGVPHKFVNLGPGAIATTDIHLSDRWIQTDLDDPAADLHARPSGGSES